MVKYHCCSSLQIPISMTDLTKRILTGSGLVAGILVAILSGPYGFGALVLLIALLCLREFYRLLEAPGERPYKTAGGLLSACLVLSCLAVASGLLGRHWLLLNVPTAFTVFAIALYRHHSKRPFEELGITFLGITAITLPLCFFSLLPFLPRPAGSYQFALPMGCLMLLWAHDTTAYLVGRTLGRHLLFQRISPKKTWEGSFGGTIAALLMSYILSRYITFLNTLQWEGLALITVVTGTYGDLFKSLLKRSRGVKDSGTILPGHGGMLDRFDSLLGSAPFIYIYIILLGK